MSGGYCAECGARVAGRFCGQCGTAVAGRPAVPRAFAAQWGAVALAVLTLVILAVLIVRQPRVTAGSPDPAAGSATAGTAPPDISGLNPRQRFDTLFNVVMRASENGDTARSARFAPMALLAYGELEDVDADARYHAAVIRLHVTGDSKPALLLADTIQANDPQHLFAFMIRGSAGQLTGDQAMVRRAASDFLSAWAREIASGKPEYQDHRIMLDQFRARALKADSTRQR